MPDVRVAAARDARCSVHAFPGLAVRGRQSRVHRAGPRVFVRVREHMADEFGGGDDTDAFHRREVVAVLGERLVGGEQVGDALERRFEFGAQGAFDAFARGDVAGVRAGLTHVALHREHVGELLATAEVFAQGCEIGRRRFPCA